MTTLGMFVWTLKDAVALGFIFVLSVLGLIILVFSFLDWCRRKIRDMWAGRVYRKYVSKQ
jgi:hypothetical protein